MQSLKTGLFLVFTILFMNNAQSQDLGEWSPWKSDQLFEELEVRYKKIEKAKSNYYYEIECRNQFSHKLSYVLVIESKAEKSKYFKFSIGENQVIKIKPDMSLNPEELNIYTFYASLNPGWPVEAR